MAIGIINGTPVHTTGGVNTHSVDVACPALGANDCHVIAVAPAGASGLASVPAGYTQVQGNTLNGTGSAGLQVLRRMGPASAQTLTLAFPGATTVLGKMAVIPFTITECDPTTPIELSNYDESLGAQSLVASTGDLLVTVYAVREGVAGATPNAFTITVPSGMTDRGYTQTDVDNGTTQIGIRVASKAISAGATGVQTATTTASAFPSPPAPPGTFSTAAVALAFNQGVVTATAPAAPTATVTPGDTQNVVNWAAPSSGGSAITDYHLERKTGSGGTYAEIGASTIGSSTLSYTDTGLTNGTTYFYRLKASNAIGDSAYSAEVSATPAAPSASGYTNVVMQTNPAHYWPLDSANGLKDIGNASTLFDLLQEFGSTPGSLFTGNVTFASDGATFAKGKGLKLPNTQDVSVTKTGMLTVMIHFVVNDYDSEAPDGYTHFMHKAEDNEHEWALRYYNTAGTTEDPPRPKRHSAYHFNKAGGKGPGSYAQPNLPGAASAEVNLDATETASVATGQEHVIVAQFWTTTDTFAGPPPGGIKIFFNGRQTDVDPMSSVNPCTPAYSAQGMRIGRNDYHSSWLIGKVRRVGVWGRLLSQPEITALTSATNRALAEGTKGSSTTTTAPTPPLNVTGTRDAATPAAARVNWTTPLSDGGSPITGYIVQHDGGGVGAGFNSGLLPSSTRTYALTQLPNVPVKITVTARNAIGDSTPSSITLTPTPILPLLKDLADNFNAGIYAQREFSGVAQANGALEADAVSSTRRYSQIRCDARGGACSYQMLPSGGGNDITSMYLRSSVDPTRQIRIVVQNGTLYATFDDGSPDPTRAGRAYSANMDVFWRISNVGSSMVLETSPSGSTWTPLGRSGFAAPAWLNDVEAGVEIYNAASI